MRREQALFDRTGGLHAAAAFDASGRLLALREDVGRHNAVDKLTGWALKARRFPLADAVLLVSGRAGYEVVQKAVASRVPVVAAVGAPSSLAAKLAEQAGVTLVGFLRAASFNVYTHPERLTS
jgi:FdhD protein